MGEVRSRVRTLNLEERVTLPGWTTVDVIDRAMAAADIFLLPSTAEGLPMAAVEALRHGLAKSGDRIVIIAGVPFGIPGSTNMLHVQRLTGKELEGRDD